MREPMADFFKIRKGSGAADTMPNNLHDAPGAFDVPQGEFFISVNGPDDEDFPDTNTLWFRIGASVNGGDFVKVAGPFV